mgnify:CR=1 FL=1
MPDSLKIRFFVQIDFFAAHGGQGGVNGGSEGTKDLYWHGPRTTLSDLEHSQYQVSPGVLTNPLS